MKMDFERSVTSRPLSRIYIGRYLRNMRHFGSNRLVLVNLAADYPSLTDDLCNLAAPHSVETPKTDISSKQNGPKVMYQNFNFLTNVVCPAVLRERERERERERDTVYRC